MAKIFYFNYMISILLCLDQTDSKKTHENNSDASNLNEPFYQTSHECLIHSKQYLFEYILTDNLRNQFSIGNIYTVPLSYIHDFDSLRWSFIPATKIGYTFYIHSVKYPSHFICATESHKFLFKMRREVHLINLSEYQKLFNNSLIKIKNCQWRFDQVKTRFSLNNTYIIWNVNYDEPLYAASSLLRKDNIRRNIFMWHQSPSKSNQFKWFMDCSKGPYLAF
jgi:hypothetical protein